MAIAAGARCLAAQREPWRVAAAQRATRRRVEARARRQEALRASRTASARSRDDIRGRGQRPRPSPCRLRSRADGRHASASRSTGGRPIVDAQRVGEFGMSLLFPEDVARERRRAARAGHRPGELLAHLARTHRPVVVNGRRTGRGGAETRRRRRTASRRSSAPMPGRVVRVLVRRRRSASRPASRSWSSKR